MAVQKVDKPGTTNSGIKKLSDGKSVIPSSTRADGSVRKEIKVKPGYRPPEDVEVYKNRTAESWKNRGKGGVPGAEAISNDDSAQLSASAAKNAKRREARKRAAASGQDDVQDQEQQTQESEASKPEVVDAEAEKAKEARKLAKKLRQARELQDKKASGEGLLPEQLAKVIKINELIRQLETMGFDTDGEAKIKSAKDDVEQG